MSIRVCQNSFSRGILSPTLSARVDLEQYNLGIKKLVNGFIAQEGCILNRAGLEYIESAKYKNKKVRLIPFNFGINQNYIIELGHRYIRFIFEGAYIKDDNLNIYELDTHYSEDEIFEIDYVQQADVITLVHQNHIPKNLSRYAHNNWILSDINSQASIQPPNNISISYTGSTASNTKTYEYVVCSVDKDSKEESTRSTVVSVLGHLEAYWTTAEKITLTWSAVENALEYNIYRSVNGIFGYVGTASNTTFIDNNIEPDLKSCAPIYVNPFESNQYPDCVCYYQQRKIYASTKSKPQTLWASQSGTNDNFNISRPLNPSDSLSMSICDNQASPIRALLPFDDLIVMTSNSEWCVNGSDKIFSANPAPVARMQSYYGCAKIKPVISGSMVLFVQSGGNIVRDLGYNYLSDSYDGQELSLLANHLFEGKKIVDMGYAKEPNRILWCVMDDGSINAITYNPKQKISAWHTHKTQGCFESVAIIRENDEDVAYFVVKREINNETVRYIERMKSRIVTSLDDSFFLDCGLYKEFDSDVSRVLGLEHLKNTKVNALLDYGVVENLIVDEEGILELPHPSKKVLIGLEYDFELETLNIEAEGTLGLDKIVNLVDVKILNSREDFFILNDNNTLCQNARSHESINYPSKLFSKDVQFCPLSDSTAQKTIKLIQKYPLPLNILAISANLSIKEVDES